MSTDPGLLLRDIQAALDDGGPVDTLADWLQGGGLDAIEMDRQVIPTRDGGDRALLVLDVEGVLVGVYHDLTPPSRATVQLVRERMVRVWEPMGGGERR